MQVHCDYCACKTATHVAVSIRMHAVEMGYPVQFLIVKSLAHWARGGSFERSFEAIFEKADVRLRVSSYSTLIF